MSSLEYKVYNRPRGYKRVMMAKFRVLLDAINYAHGEADLFMQSDPPVTITVVAGNTVLRKVPPQ